MIHLSRLILDPMSRQVQNELASPYEMHRTLSHAFPNLSKAEWEASRVLFRTDEANGVFALLVQSHLAPDWAAFASHLKGRYLLQTPQVKSWEPQLAVGQSLRFRLVANPTFAPKREGAKRGERKGLYREAERLDWLRRQGERCGFEMNLVNTVLQGSPEKPVVFRGQEHQKLELALPLCEVVDLNDGRRFALPARPENGSAWKDLPVKPFQKNQFSAARFEGVLRVTDVAAFTRALENGIGKARGFGFGLLSVAPASK